jgi:hypothetical protein
LVRRILLKHLQDSRKGAAFRFADEQMNVFGHDHVTANEESVPLAHTFQGLLEDVTGVRVRRKRLSMMTTEGYEVETLGLLNALESPWHAVSIFRTEE